MKQLIMVFCFLVSFIFVNAQPINWRQSNHWKLYSLNKSKALSYPVDTLSHFKSVTLDDSSVISFLIHAKLLSKKVTPVWMGFYIASYETPSHQPRKVIISNYGGFLYDSFSKRYYEIPIAKQDDWSDFITKDLDSLFNPNKN